MAQEAIMYSSSQRFWGLCPRPANPSQSPELGHRKDLAGPWVDEPGVRGSGTCPDWNPIRGLFWTTKMPRMSWGLLPPKPTAQSWEQAWLREDWESPNKWEIWCGFREGSAQRKAPECDLPEGTVCCPAGEIPPLWDHSKQVWGSDHTRCKWNIAVLFSGERMGWNDTPGHALPVMMAQRSVTAGWAESVRTEKEVAALQTRSMVMQQPKEPKGWPRSSTPTAPCQGTNSESK